MKRTGLSLIAILLLAFPSYSQIVNIPDTVFFYALLDKGIDTDGDSLISVTEAEEITFLDVSGRGNPDLGRISDLSGIEAFVNIDTLICSRNNLSALDLSENTALTYLDCASNQLISLNINNCTALISLDVNTNQLEIVDVSNNVKLTTLNCRTNELVSLDISKNDSLALLDCRSNQLDSLLVSNNLVLETLYCQENRLGNLDISKNMGLVSLDISSNALSNLDISNNDTLQFLACGSNQLTHLDLSKNPALLFLYCELNQLINLDVTNNINLVNLELGGNLLTSLDISNNVKIGAEDMSISSQISGLYIQDMPTLHNICVFEDFFTRPNPGSDFDGVHVDTTGSLNVEFATDCGSNVLTVSDTVFFYKLINEGVDSNGDSLISYGEAEAIRHLNVSRPIGPGEKITDLTGIEAFINLDTLNCSYNELTSLDLSSNTALTNFACEENLLSNLDLSFNTALTDLNCRNNQLTGLDVSQNTALTYLNCQNNKLPGLDVSQDTALTYLSCDVNLITTLDLSANSSLNYLSCGANQIDSLDLTENIDLETLVCNWNDLSALDLSQNTALTVLDCFSNQLSSLDLSNNTLLTELVCEGNLLTSLNLSDNTGLVRLICGYNQLSTLNLCQNQSIEILNIQEMPSLGSVYVWSSFPDGVIVHSTNSPNVEFLDCSLVGIEKSDDSGLSIYPNPTKGLLSIESERSPLHSIKITSLNGQQMFSANTGGSTHQIDLTSLQKGIYFITVRSKNFVTTRKIIKL